MRTRGFGLIEVVVASAVVVVGFLAAASMLGSSSDAARVQDVRMKMVRDGQDVLDRIGAELIQSSAEPDPLGDDKITVLDEGRTLRFRRVVGATVTAGSVIQQWSEAVTVAWDAGEETLTRREGAGPVTVLTNRVVDFEARLLPDGLVVLELERAVPFPKGDPVRHRGCITVKPRNPGD